MAGMLSSSHLFEKDQADDHLEGEELCQWLVFLHVRFEIAVKSKNGRDGKGDGHRLNDIEL